MATEQNNTFINTFTGGMNTDSAYDTIKNNQYIYAVNLRPYGTSKIYNSHDIAAYGKYGVMTPVKALNEDITSSTPIPKFDTEEIQRIIKVITAGDTNILIKLYKNYLYLYKVVASDKLPRYIWQFLCKIKVREKEANDLRNVSAVLQYETDDVVNLYIADGEHKIMIINVKDTTYINSLRDKNGEINVDLISQNMYFPKNAITYNAIVSGQLKTSQVQYTYRFYKKYGVTSKLAPLSRKYQVINPSRDTEVGCAENTTTSIGLQLEMKVNEKIDQFDRLQVYRIQYLKPNQNAEIDLIYDGELAKNEKGATIHIIDNGRKTLQTLSVEEFSQIHGQDIIPTLLEQNQGYLFAGNVKDTTIFQLDREDLKKFWAIQFTPVGNNEYEIPYLATDTYSEPRGYVYEVESGDEAVQRFISDKIFGNADYSNPYADVNHDFDKNYSNVMFDYNNYIGGSGIYISWKLLVANVSTDEETISTYSSSYLHYNTTSNEFEYYSNDASGAKAPKEKDIISDCGFPKPDKVQHNNATTSSCIRSLKRGEVYRYGIILYKNDGTRSDVVWIGDIRIPGPDIVELNKNYTTKQIGIEFTLNEAFKEFANTNRICGYEIVRCQRTDEYSRSLQQVVIASTVRQKLVDGTYSPYYPTGFIISNPQYIGYTPYDIAGTDIGYSNALTQWPEQMTSGASDNRLYQVYCPEIQTYVDDVLNKLKANQIKLAPALYLYSSKTDIARFTKDNAYDPSTDIQIKLSDHAQKGKIFSLSFVPLIMHKVDGTKIEIDKHNYTFGKYTNVNYKVLGYSKSDKSNKINKLSYLDSASAVYSRRFFMLDSNDKIVQDNGEPVLRPSDINSEYEVDIDNVQFTKDTKFNLNQNNYSMQIREISNVRMLNWEDGFSNHVMNGSKISNAVKKYKSYAKNVSTSSYLNWVCSSKYDIPVGTSEEPGWSGNVWKNVVEFTNVTDSGQHETRTFPAIGPIGPAARCLVVQLSDDKEKLDDLIDTKDGSTVVSHSLKYIFGEVITTNFIGDMYIPNNLGGTLIPSSDPEVNSNDPEEVSKLNSYPGTLLCEITHPAIHYSGKDMSSKQYDTYYGFGDYKAYSSDGVNKINVFTGDTYTQIYEIEGMYKAYDFNDDKSSLQSMQTIHYIPMESTINQYFDYGMNYRNTNNANLQAEAGEIKGVTSQDRPVHQYNLIYSDNGTSNDLYSPQSTTHLQNTYTQRICYSQLKTNGEFLNSWNIFKPIDYIDVNPVYGELTDLFTTQDTLYFWQTKAFGRLSVNERSLVKDENSNLIQLGQGTVLQRSDYLSTKFGMKAQDMCKVNVDNDIYWFDYGNKCIAAYKATSGAYGGAKMSVLDFTESCNVKTLMQINITDNVQVPTITYDATNDELLFHPIKNNAILSEEMTLAFNCKLGIAQSMYSMLNGQLATVYNNLTNQNDAISINNKLMLYTRWCDNDETPTTDDDTAELHFVVNPNPSTTKVFDNQQIVFPQLYNTASSHTGQTANYDNFDCNLYTDLDRAGIVDEYTNREGNICFPIPRCADGIRRLRGKWMIEEILMNSNNGDHAISHIITKFRQSYN